MNLKVLRNEIILPDEPLKERHSGFGVPLLKIAVGTYLEGFSH